MIYKVKSHTNSTGNNKTNLLFKKPLGKVSLKLTPFAVAKTSAETISNLNRTDLFDSRKNKKLFFFCFNILQKTFKICKRGFVFLKKSVISCNIY